MATFNIHEDDVENSKQQIFLASKSYKEQDKKVVAKRREGLRVVLQPVNNLLDNRVKRVKLVKNKEPVEAIPLKKSSLKFNTEGTEVKLECFKLINKETYLKTQKHKIVKEKVDIEESVCFCEYKADIWSYLQALEGKTQYPKANYMRKQMHLTENMRCMLVDWLVSVSEEYKMSEQTLHLSVNYIDRFLSHMSVVRDKFQLLGSAAMMIASKMEEIYPPDTKEWSFLSGSTYTKFQIQRMEQLLLRVLRFDLQPPTMITFIQHFCDQHKLDRKTTYLAMYLSELILLEGDSYLHYVPSKLAAACVALARHTLSKPELWPSTFESSSGYSLKQLSPVVQKQHRTFKDSPTKPHQAIQTKYQGTKYHQVALLKPKVLWDEY